MDVKSLPFSSPVFLPQQVLHECLEAMLLHEGEYRPKSSIQNEAFELYRVMDEFNENKRRFLPKQRHVDAIPKPESFYLLLGALIDVE